MPHVPTADIVYYSLSWYVCRCLTAYAIHRWGNGGEVESISLIWLCCVIRLRVQSNVISRGINKAQKWFLVELTRSKNMNRCNDCVNKLNGFAVRVQQTISLATQFLMIRIVFQFLCKTISAIGSPDVRVWASCFDVNHINKAMPIAATTIAAIRSKISKLWIA